MLYLFHVCSVTPESPRGQCCCQILVSTEARAQPASRPGPFHCSLSAAFTPISYSLTSGHHFCSTWRKSAIQDFWFFFLIFFFEHYNILRFALMFFFLLNCERTRKNLFRKCLGPHQSYCMPTSAARERGSDVFPTFSQQRPATHPKDNHRLLTDFINSQEPEGKTDRARPSLFTLRNLTLIEHNYVLYKAAAHAQVLVIFVLHGLRFTFLFCFA